jgi:DNA-binding NtrC family response regulator
MSYVKARTWATGRSQRGLREFTGIVGNSGALKDALKEVDALLRAGAPALVLEGETGTGKTLLARAIHDRRGAHRHPFLFFPTASLPVHLLEGQLFGTSTGSPGLLALASRGTLVLENGDALPSELQDGLAELFPVAAGENDGEETLGDQEDLPLVILTTRKTLQDEMGSVPFHPPLADALQPVRIILPPLRKREGDVEVLTRHFLGEVARKRGNGSLAIMPEAMEALERHPWPGNIRELKNTLEQAAALAPGSTIRLEHLRIRTRATRPLTGEEALVSEMILVPPEGKSLEEIESEAVKATLDMTQGNRSQAARILGVSRPTLARKIRKYHLNGDH